jgi:hypothetical protein
MKASEIELRGVYTNRNEVFARVVEEITSDGYVLYRDFGLSDGEPIGSGRCQLFTFGDWAARPATDEERGRLRWKAAREKDRALLRELLSTWTRFLYNSV